MPKSLKQIINQGEGVSVELKSRFNDEVIETIAAFSNTVGGIVIIGVDNQKRVIGYLWEMRPFKI